MCWNLFSVCKKIYEMPACSNLNRQLCLGSHFSSILNHRITVLLQLCPVSLLVYLHSVGKMVRFSMLSKMLIILQLVSFMLLLLFIIAYKIMEESRAENSGLTTFFCTVICILKVMILQQEWMYGSDAIQLNPHEYFFKAFSCFPPFLDPLFKASQL